MLYLLVLPVWHLFFYDTVSCNRLWRIPSQPQRYSALRKTSEGSSRHGMSSDSNCELRGRIDRMTEIVVRSRRDKGTGDILEHLEVVEGPVGSTEMLLLMEMLLEKRDHSRFGDLISFYDVTSKNEMTRLHSSSTACLDVSGLDTRDQGYSELTNIGDNTALEGTNDALFTDFASDKKKRVKLTSTFSSPPDTVDLNVLMMMIHSMQQMKPKRRSEQSAQLFDKIKDSNISRRLLNVFLLSMITAQNVDTTDDTSSPASLLDSFNQLFNEKLNDDSEITRAADTWKPDNTSAPSPHIDDTAANNENLITSGLSNLITPEMFITAMAYSPSWKNVHAVLTEFKQHSSWQKSYNNLNVITCLNILHGTVLDKSLHLLTLQAIRTLNGEQSASDTSIYREGLDFIQYLLANNIVLRDKSEGNEGVGSLKTCRIVNNRDESEYVYRTSDTCNEILSFMGCKIRMIGDESEDEEGNDMGQDKTDSFSFFTDPRLLRAVELTQGPQRLRLREGISHSTLSSNKNNSSNSTNNSNSVQWVSANSGSFHCSFFESIQCSIVKRTDLKDDLSPSDILLGTEEEDVPKRIRILVLGDGDISFSAALIKSQQERRSLDNRRVEKSEYEGEDEVGVTEEGKRSLEGERGCDDIPPGGTARYGIVDLPDSIPLEIIATSFESQSSLFRKYAGAEENVLFITGITTSSASVTDELTLSNDTPTNSSKRKVGNINKETIEGGRSLSEALGEGRGHTVLYQVDATNISVSDFQGDAFDTIIFNFPFGDAMADTSSDVSNTRGGNRHSKSPTVSRDEKLTDDDSAFNDSQLSAQQFSDSIGSSSGDVELSQTNTLDSPRKRKNKSRSKSNVSSDFDTHWVARGRHMHLMDGVFRSAKNVLKNVPRNVPKNVLKTALHPTSLDPNSAGIAVDNSSGDSEEEGEKEQKVTVRVWNQKVLGPRVMVTLLLSQALEWEVERLAAVHGFSLTEIIPFEDLIFAAAGYSRKRTYADDIFPSSSSSPSPSRLHSDATILDPHLTEFINDSQTTHSNARNLYSLQRKQWQRNTVVAWTFVFTHSS